MASISLLHYPSQCPRHCCFTNFSDNKGIKICMKQRVLCYKNHDPEQEFILCSQEEAGFRRRQVLFQMSSAFSVPVILSDSLARADVPGDFRVYTDDVNKFKISIPQDWQVGAGEPNGFKSITAFYPEGASSSNVSVVITGLGPDFTRMESFGKVDAFADTLVSGLDRSWQRPPGVAAKLIDCMAANGFYYIEYTMQNPGESRRHLFSAIGMASNGWYNRLYTVTGQFLEEDTEKYGSRIKKAVKSFNFV
ncbi:PsbP domain-containing protein [Cephalotus follicularis]|uniref:PsbP domain-containing protein n=1 Tax=Cephalotus follicularis TaxID=3775 RepID=A0A1Q3BCV4_CEPFO|nr:PsbP domain-containing protein [Cephalotus follicularis]